MGRIDQTTQYGIFQFSIFLQKRVQFFEEEEMIMHEGGCLLDNKYVKKMIMIIRIILVIHQPSSSTVRVLFFDL